MSTFGDELRRWRENRRLSQLDLSLQAEVSQRHLSFLETGRSEPSRDMVLRLADALDVPLRERNQMLVSAGFAAAWPERGLDDVDLAQVKHVLDALLRAHEPYPAYVVDRHWNLVLANDASARLTALGPDPVATAMASGGNVLRLFFHPDGLRPVVANWEESAAVLLRRLRQEVAHQPGDRGLLALLDEVVQYPDVAGLDTALRPLGPDDLLVPVHIRTGDLDLRFFTTITTIGAAYDITLEELRVEALLPADDATEQALHELARP